MPDEAHAETRSERYKVARLNGRSPMVQQLARRLRAAFESTDSDYNFEATLLALAGRSAGRQWTELAVKLYEHQAKALRRQIRTRKDSTPITFASGMLQ